MFKHKRAQIKLLPNHDGPPEPAPLSLEITRNQGSSVAIEATQGSLQGAQKPPTASLSVEEQKTRQENNELRQELARQQRKNRARLRFIEKVMCADELLQQAIIEFQRLEGELSGPRGGEPRVPTGQGHVG